MQKEIGFIGLGTMGAPMVRNLAKKHRLVVYDRDPEKMEQVQGPKVRPSQSVSQVCASAPIVLLSLPGSETVKEVICAKDGLATSLSRGSVIIDTGTTEPSVIQEVAQILSARGIDFLDAPVSGGEKGAIEGTLAIMVGGKEDVFEQCRPPFGGIGNHNCTSRG